VSERMHAIYESIGEPENFVETAQQRCEMFGVLKIPGFYFIMPLYPF
jgi:hypothetical protein